MRKIASPSLSHERTGRSVAESHCRAFTLIELLVVISILAILMSIIISGMSGAIASAKRVQAKNDAAQIATAVIAFEAEYGKMPTNCTTVSGTLLSSLMGLNTADNPRGIVFLDVNPAKKGKSGTNANGFVDPFNTNTAYAISMDTNYVNSIGVNMSGGSSTNTPLRKKVGVWNITTNSSQQVRSWE